MIFKNKPSYKELQQRLTKTEAALNALRSEQIDSSSENSKTLLARITQAEARGSHLEQVLLGMRNISQLIAHPIAFISPDFRYLSVNHAYTKYFGVDTDQIIGHTSANFLGNEVFNLQIKPSLQRCLQGETVRFQTQINFTSLGKRWLDINYLPYFDEHGVIKGVVVQSYDITEQKQAQLALQESEVKFRTLVDQAPQALFLHAMDSAILDVNQAAVERYGYSRRELLSMSTRDIDPDYKEREDSGRFWQELKEAHTITFEARHRRKDGSLFPVKIRQSAVEIQGQKCIFSLAEDITEQKKAEQSLRDSEELFRTVFEHAAVGIAQVAPNGRFQQVNTKLCEITGYTKEEFRELNFADITHPDDLYLDETQIARVLSGEINGFEIEKRYHHKEGYPIWIKLYSRVLRDENGSAKYAIASITDITQEKVTLKKLEQSEQKFRDLVDNTIDWVWQVDDDLNFIYTSPNVQQLTGYTISEVLGKKPFNHMQEDESKRVKAIFDKIIPKRERILNLEIHQTHKNGKPIVFETNATPIFEDDGSLAGYFGTCRDITERKQNEEDLRLYFYSLSQIKDRVVITDLEGNIFYINDSTCRMLGRTREELIGQNVATFGEDDSTGITQANLIKKTRQDGFWRGEVTNYRADGSPVYLDSRIFLVKDDQGHSIALCGISTDITESKRVQEALRDSEQLLRDVIDTDPSCIFVKDRQGKYILVNQAIAKLYGTFPEDMLGKTDRDFIGAEVATKEELEKFILNDLQVIESNQLKFIPEESMTYPDGSVHWFQTHKVPIQIEGKGVCLLGVAIDITERKRIEDVLRKNEAILNEAQEIAHVASYFWDVNSDKLEWSRHMFKIAGLDPETFTGKLSDTINQMIHPADRDMVNDQIVEMVKQKRTSEMEFRLVRPDGDVRWLRSRARFTFDDQGNPIFATGVHHDITDYHQVMQDLSESERQLDLILNSTSEMVVFYDIDLRIIWANQASAQSVQLSSQDLIGKHCYELWRQHDKPCQDCPVLFARDHKEPHRGEQQTPDGRYWSIRGYPVFDDMGEVTALIEFTLDITKQKKAEQELLKYRDHLEELVHARTEKLNKMINMMAGREVRMAELKEAIKKLRSQLSSAGIEPLANDPLLEALEEFE